MPWWIFPAFLALAPPVAARAESAPEQDCNGNGVEDARDIDSGESLDCDLDGVPDECAAPLGFHFAFRQVLRAGQLSEDGLWPIVVEDLDGDGRADLATARPATWHLSVIWNEGSRRFSASEDLPLPFPPLYVKAADLDLDGDPDLVVGPTVLPDFEEERLLVVENLGGRHLEVSRVEEGLPYPVILAVGDFDGDGAPDVAASNLEGRVQHSSLTLLWGDGEGGFSERTQADFMDYPSRQIWVADLNGDGRDDILAIARNLPVLRLAAEGRRFEEPVVLPVRQAPWHAAFWDLDSDGDLDVAISQVDTNRLTFLRNDGSGRRFEVWEVFREERNPVVPVFADVDRDGRVDLVAGGTPNAIWYGGPGGLPGDTAKFRRYGGGGSASRAVRDMDGDKWPDIVTHSWEAAGLDWDDISIVYNRGDGRFEARALYYLYDIERFDKGLPTRTVARDFDQDGDLDLASGHGEGWRGTRIYFSWNDGAGGFEDHEELVFPGTSGAPVYARALAPADLDRDGDEDLVAVGAHGWLVIENLGGTEFAGRGMFEDGVSYDHAVTWDFDADGWVDFAFGDHWGWAYVVWNGGGWDFSQPQEAAEGGNPLLPRTLLGLGAGDWDRDGRGDLALLQWGIGDFPSRVLLVFGREGRSFAARGEIALERIGMDLHVADLDGDGIQDLVVAERPQDINTPEETRVHTFAGDGRGGFEHRGSRRIQEYYPRVSSGDLDLDGDREVLVTGGSIEPFQTPTTGRENHVELFLNRGDGSLGRRLVLPFDSRPAQALVEDLDGDGDMDLAVTQALSVTVAVALNEAPGGVTPSEPLPCGVRFRRGDTRPDGVMNWGDAVVTLRYLFTFWRAPSCLDAADTDDDGRITLSDPVYGLNMYYSTYRYRGGPAPPPPYPGCGFDPTPDELDCQDYAGCPD